jgi:hypothetical protein
MNDAIDRENVSEYKDRFTGDLIRVSAGKVTDGSAEADRIKGILADGHSAAFRVFGTADIPGIADVGVSCANLLPAPSMATITTSPTL